MDCAVSLSKCDQVSLESNGSPRCVCGGGCESCTPMDTIFHTLTLGEHRCLDRVFQGRRANREGILRSSSEAFETLRQDN